MNALEVAEDVMTSAKIDAAGKARILLALIRARELRRAIVRDWRDDELLAIEDPREYQLRLAGYWLLLHGGASGARDAFERAERGDEPKLEELKDPAVLEAWPRARAAVLAEIERQKRGQLRNRRTAIALLAVGIARGQAA